MNRPLITILLSLGLASVATAAPSTPDDSVVGPYVGLSLGISQVGTTGVSAVKTAADERDRAVRVFAGYQLTEHWGVEAGYVRLGQLQDRFRVGSVDVAQSVRAQSLYVAGTGRLPLGAGFAVTGKAGLSFGKVTGTDALTGSDALTGTRTSAVLGVGAEYRLNRDLAFTVDIDTFGKVSRRVAASALTAGIRLAF